MLTFYQKYYVHINLFLVVLLGLACGLLGGALLDTNIGWEQNNSSRSVPQQLKKIKGITSADLNSILQRNPFDPSSRSNSVTVDLGADEVLSLSGSSKNIGKSTNSKRILL